MANQGASTPVGRSEYGIRIAYAVNALCATAALVYFVSWGFRADAILDGYYEIQAHSLAQGHLYAVPGPSEVYYHDVSMYHGYYYFYFGLLPSTLYLALKGLVGRMAAHYAVVTAFLFCLLYFYQRIIAQIVDAALEPVANARIAWRLSSLPLLWVFFFILPFPRRELSWFFDNFYVYEQQILFGLALAFPAAFLLIKGIGDRSAVHVCSAAFLFSVAAYARGTWFLLACGGIPAGLLVSRVLTRDGHDPRGFRRGLGWLAGSACLLSGLLFLNYLRFDSPWDFGIWYRQNPASDVFFRASTGFFSPEAKGWTLLFNVFAYYGSPGIIRALGLDERSFSLFTEWTPSLFSYNPQFLPLLIGCPLAIYRLVRTRRSLLPAAIVVGGIAVYVNVLVGGIPPAVSSRYFMEFYYFSLLTLFIVLVALVPYRLAFPLMLLMFAVHIPMNVDGYTSVHPNLRTVKLERGAGLQVGLDFNRDRIMDIYIVQRPVWPKGTASRSASASLAPYNAIGLYRGPDERFLMADVAAVYLIPSARFGAAGPANRLTVTGLRSQTEPGRALLYVEGCLVGSLRLDPGVEVDGHFDVPFELRDNAPFQVMTVFLPDGRDYLPERPPQVPPLLVKAISLSPRTSK